MLIICAIDWIYVKLKTVIFCEKHLKLIKKAQKKQKLCHFTLKKGFLKPLLYFKVI